MHLAFSTYIATFCIAIVAHLATAYANNEERAFKTLNSGLQISLLGTAYFSWNECMKV
jgi:hypothetical protein